MVDGGIRGGVSMISTRHAQANNASITTFDAAPPTSFISYLEPNKQYGWAINQPLQIGGYSWMTAEESRAIDCLSPTEAQPEGFFIEASVHYPVELH